jgi:hypothetical protein
VPPDMIRVEHPLKTVYDFRNKSNNMRILKENSLYTLQTFDSEKRCDSIIEEGDLKKLEIELKKKYKKR